MQISCNKRQRLHKKRVQLPRIGLGHQHGRLFIVLGYQHGHCDFMWKHSIVYYFQVFVAYPRSMKANEVNCQVKDCKRLLLSEQQSTDTGFRGDVFVVRTSKPVENLWKNGLFWSRYSFVTHYIYRKPRDWGLARSAYSIIRASVALRATCRALTRIWLAVIYFQNGE